MNGKENEDTQQRIRDIEEELQRLKGRVEEPLEESRWTSARPVNRMSTMSIQTSLKEDLFDERIGDETQSDVVRRILEEVRADRELWHQIIKILGVEETAEKKVEYIKNLIEYDEKDVADSLPVINNGRIDYEVVEKKYDPNLTDAENAENTGIGLSSFVTWRNSKGYPARGRKKGSEWNKKSKK